MRTATLALILTVTACAAAGTGPSRNDAVITQDEIIAVNELNVLDLIRVERPHWLRHRGSTSVSQDPEILIYIDGVRTGRPEILRDIATINVEEIRYYDARRAQYRFGVGHVQGAIDVITQRG
jgi:hypothetical protein